MDIEKITNSIVFRGMTEDDLVLAMKSLDAAERDYARDEIILHAGDVTDTMGLVLSGSVRIENNDMWGNRTILSHVAPGQVFAETYAMVPSEPLLVDAVANQDCRILMLRIGHLVQTQADSLQAGSSSWSTRLMSNMLTISMRKNLMLSGRSFHTSPKTIRGKVMSYLSSVSLHESSDEFDIPFDRQQLADYLNVDRTALSKELGRMRQDGLITYRRNHFRIISQL